jgi:prepilin-type N-terminal cleavage/methylation domain-containing protein
VTATETAMCTQRTSSKTRAGFTLIELLAVIMILGILAWALLVNLGDAARAFDVKVTQVTMQKVGLAISQYSDAMGDFPRSKFTAEQGTPPNETNLGSECLYLALCAEKAPGDAQFDEYLSNTDEDQTAKRMPGFQVSTLLELHDQWENPIAYFHHSDYGREDTYVTIGKEGERIESKARARRNEATQRYYEANGYQMISAGPDGAFGGDDDVYNFRVK